MRGLVLWDTRSTADADGSKVRRAVRARKDLAEGAAAIPGATLAAIERAERSGHLERPDAFDAALLACLHDLA